MNPLIGKTITSIEVAKDKKAIKFNLADANSIIVKADGDCCSSTWIESLDMPEAILGAPVTAVEDIPMPDLGQPEYDVIQYYGCKITTTKGSCVIDYRNESNGYYGGNLSWPEDDYFYGGVYGQNISKEEWETVQ